MKKIAALVALSAALATPAWATDKTVTLSVPGMTCAACPITFKTAFSRVPGVKKVVVHFNQHDAVVTFDDAKTQPAALTKATTDAGYPPSIKQGG